MGLRDLERAIERGVDGVLGRVFRADVSKLEIEKRVEREVHAAGRLDKAGKRVVPNDVEVHVHPDDLAKAELDVAGLEKALTEQVRENARLTGGSFEGPLSIRVAPDDEAQLGTIAVYATSAHSIAGMAPGTLEFPDGYKLDLTTLGPDGVVMGRDRANGLVVDDQNASRQHALLRPSPQGWIVEDLGSTNGTRVNGFRTNTQVLSDGDQLSTGSTTFIFHAY